MQTAIQQAADALAELPDAAAHLETAVVDSDAARIAEAIATAVPLVRAVMTAMTAVSDAVRSAATGAGNARAEVEAFAEELVQRLAGYALVNYLDRERPTASHLMILLGVIEIEAQAATPATPAYTRRVLRTDRLTRYCTTRPTSSHRYMVGAQTVRMGCAVASASIRLRPGLRFRLRAAGRRRPATLSANSGYRHRRHFGSDTRRPGRVAGRDQRSNEFHCALGGYGRLTAEVDGGLEAGAALQLFPPADLHVVPPSADVSGTVRFGVQAPRAAQAQPIIAIGSASGTRIEARALRLGAGADFDWNVVAGRAEGELLIDAEVVDGKFVIDTADADGFLDAILPEGPLELDAGVRVAWSSATGLHVTGSAGLDVDLPVDFDVGPVKILALHAGLAIEDDALALELSAAITAKFGPVTLAVDRMGTTTPAVGSPTVAETQDLPTCHWLSSRRRVSVCRSTRRWCAAEASSGWTPTAVSMRAFWSWRLDRYRSRP